MTESATLFGLFVSAFISATLAPGGSEAILAVLLNLGDNPWWVLVAIATLGNSLGSLTSYGLGRLVHQGKRPEDLVSGRARTALTWVERYGIWTLLLSWLPVVGDALPLLAGWFRFPLWSSTLLIILGKLARYLVIALVTAGVTGSA